MEETKTVSVKIGESLDTRKNVNKEPHSYDELPEEVKKYIKDRRRNGGDRGTVIHKLEGKHMLSLIIYLDKMSPVIKSDIYNDVARTGTILDKIKDLEDYGIIRIYTTGKTNNNVIVMTEKGHAVAEKLREFVSLVESDF